MKREPTDRERWRSRRLTLGAIPLLGWFLVAGGLIAGGGSSGNGRWALGCVGVMTIFALIVGGLALTIAIWLSRNEEG
ncbi:MAG: hypothetical protein AAGA81_17940 [Acidobacteriota bacterium]